MFEVGQKVIAVDNHAYKITKGKEYEVFAYIPSFRCENGFTFPEYVTVLDDFGVTCTAYTWRFKAKE